jgi:hypothetical protein
VSLGQILNVNFLHVAQQTRVLFFHLFPSVCRHDFDWVTPEEFDGFLPEPIGWILLVDQQQLETIVNRHVEMQMFFALGFQLIQ